MVLTPVRSMSDTSGLQMNASGSGKISARYFAIGAKTKSLAGWSGIGVLVVGFSQIGTLKKHALFVFSWYIACSVPLKAVCGEIGPAL